MALTAYQTELTSLIQAPSSPNPLIPTASQTTFINLARQQIAGDGECVRCTGGLALTNGTQSYTFASIGGFSLAGVTGVLSVRQGAIGNRVLDLRSWEWFLHYRTGSSGAPVMMAQQLQGANGNLSFDPIPNGTFTIVLDIVGNPQGLALDADPEAIPYPWTDAVPFYAAWLALMSLQRQLDADKMYERYLNLMARARKDTTPTVLPDYMPGGQGAGIVTNKTNLGSTPPRAR